MRVNFSAGILDLGGHAVEDGGKPLTLGDLCVAALMVADPKATGEELFRRFRLAEKIHAGGEPDLSIDELAQVKAAVGKNPHPLVVGRAWSLLEGK